MNIPDVICDAVETFGIEHQTRKLFEEMAELQEAICKSYSNRADAHDICSEIADVIIMCSQMAVYYGKENVEKQITFKLNRLTERLINYKKKQCQHS